MKQHNGHQVACLTYWGNWRERMQEWCNKGYIAVLCDNHVRIYSRA